MATANASKPHQNTPPPFLTFNSTLADTLASPQSSEKIDWQKHTTYHGRLPVRASFGNLTTPDAILDSSRETPSGPHKF
jgi:hypothetical protein